MKGNYVFSILCCIFLISSAGQAQVETLAHGGQQPAMAQVLSPGDRAERLWTEGEMQWKSRMSQALSINIPNVDQFIESNISSYYKDRSDFFQGVMSGTISADKAAGFFDEMKTKYVNLYKAGSPSSLQTPQAKTSTLPTTQAACNPSCFNIGFTSGDLSGWSAYYGVDASTQAAIAINSKTGGVCGSVTQAAGPNPNTGGTYHVQLMPTAGTDPIAGALIPYTPPLGGKAVMVGDGSNVTFGVGILEQTYMADLSAPILTIQYAVVLENPPSHLGYLQPWFRVEVLDASGNPVPGCGQYFVVAASGLPGFKAFPSGSDTVYARPWSTVFVPLYNYIGQCITVRVTASDCGQGGHFGYGYFAATCSKLDLLSSSKVWCTGQQEATIKGPPGDPNTTYAWSGGCISGPSNQQTVKVSCAGTYSLIVTSGAQCKDTFSIDIPAIAAGPPPVPCFTANKVCSGTPTSFDASCTTPATGNKYYWDFYNTGQYNDSSGPNPQWTFPLGGYYPVRLHVETANGCGADTIITIPVDSTNNAAIPQVTYTVTDATACGQCNGKVAVTIVSTSKVVITTSWCTGSATVGGGSISTSFSCGTGISASGSKATLTFSNLCPGIYYVYWHPQNVIPPSACNPGGTISDTITAIVAQSGVNITANIISSSASCGKSNGSATVTGIGGSSGVYTYTWSPVPTGGAYGSSKTGLSPGTYTVTIKDANGCLGVTKVVIGNFAQLTAQAIPFDVSCFGANNGSVNIIPTAGVGPFSYVWSPSSAGTSASASNLGPGTYSVLVTDAGGCSGTVSAVVNEPTQVLSQIDSAITNVNCGQTGSATVSAKGGYAPYTYKWANGTLGQTVTGLPAGTTTFTVTDAFGCTDTGQVTVYINNGPTVDAGLPQKLCIGNSVNLSGTTATGVTYSWSPAGSASCSTCLNTSVNPTATTLYTLEVKDATGCSSIDTVTVFVNLLPIVAAGNTSPVCLGTPVQLTASGGTTYDWNTTPPQSGSPINITPPAGTSNYTVTVTDVNGCVNTTSTSVTVNPLPVVLVTPPQAICLGASATLTSSGGAIYSWSTGETTSSITVTPTTTTSYTVAVLDVNSCPGANITSVTVNPLASVQISPPVSLCPGSSTQLTTTGGTIYLWSTGETTTAITVTPPSTSTYSVDVTDANGCKGSANVTVTINPQLTVTMSTPLPICIGSSTIITAFPTGGTTYTYSWTPSNPGGMTCNNCQSPTVTPTTTTTYSVSIDDIAGCHGDNLVTVVVNPLPNVNADPPAMICAGQSATFNATGANTYVWSSGQLTPGITLSPPAGAYTYTVTGTDGNGCIDTATTALLVNPLPVVTISSAQTICTGDIISLTSSGAGTGTYSWNPTIGLTPATGSSVSASPSSSTTYVVSVVDTNGCTGMNSVAITVVPPPTATTGNADICTGQTAQLTASGGLNYSWTPSIYLSNPNIANPISVSPNSITYTVTVTSGPTCPPATAAATVTVHPAPMVVASADTSIIAGYSAQLTSVGTGLTYNWSPSTWLSCSACPNPLATPLRNTLYVVTTMDAYGCVSTDTVLIKVEDILTLYVPTAFTPYNYDEHNNIFFAYGVGIWQFEFYIFDRWGTKIFESTDPYVGWDGTYKGQMVQQDVYVWLAKAVSITGKSITKTGPVTVVK